MTRTALPMSRVQRLQAALSALDRRAILTQVAFVLTLALATARCTMTENLRQAAPVLSGSTAPPREAGPATTLALNLLCCAPTLLVLGRRWIDRDYVLRWNWSHVLMFPLALWTALSYRWADDRFAAVIGASTLVSALALLWASAQLVRSWLRLRIVAAVAFGLLITFQCRGFYFKFSESPDSIRYFENHRREILATQGYADGTFAAKQFELKVTTGEMLGFTGSANAFASMIVLCMVLGLGIMAQRRASTNALGWIIPIALMEILALWLLVYTKSKAAALAPILAVGFLVMIWRWGDRMAAHARRAFWIGVACVAGVFLAVLGLGIVRNRLPTDSLNFRWRYWVGCWRMFWRHPILGVGWDNFGLHYLRDRLPVASEEIRDPHNFIIRFFIELGAVGGILMLAWMGRVAWEISRPIVPPQLPAPAKPAAQNPFDGIFLILAAALAGLAINAAASIDFKQTGSWIFLEVFARVVYAIGIVLGALIATLQHPLRPRLDDRPAPWILYGVIVAIGIFLIQNLIEFSLFEAGPMCLFAVLVGAVLGIRQPTVAGRKKRPLAAKASLVLAGVLLLPMVMYLVLPVTSAEHRAHMGDDFLRRGDYGDAAGQFGGAFKILPMNGDYAYRAGLANNHAADIIVRQDHLQAMTEALYEGIKFYYDQAARTNPADVRPYLRRAELAAPSYDVDTVNANFQAALRLDPNDVSIRREYARTLADLELPEAAKVQYQLALSYNDQLDPAEPKRLSAEEIQSIRDEIRRLSKP